MVKVYKENSAVIIEQPSRPLVYLNTDDTRLFISGEVFMINDGQAGQMYEIGTYDKITNKLGTLVLGSYEDAYSYLLGVLEVTSTFGTDAGPVDVQNPLPTDGDSIYVKDLDLPNCDNGNFGGLVSDYFDSLSSFNEDTTSNNPKSITLMFQRTVYASSVGLGCADQPHGFGDSITLKLLGSGGVVRNVIQSSGDTNSRLIPFEPTAFNGIILEFNTADTVCLSNITIRKESTVSARLQGIDPNKTLRNVNVNLLGNLLVSLDEQKDAFGRLKTADPFTIFDSSITNQASEDLFWTYLINGTSSKLYDRDTSKVTMTVAADGDYVVRQTKERFKYQPAKSHEFFITGQWPTIPNVRCRGGLVDFDNIGGITPDSSPQNGIFFENNGGVLSWNIANNGVITETATQDQWNIDSCDGAGKSGFVFNPDSTNIIAAQLEWLGVGVVVVGFAIGAGSVIYCHAFQHASVDGVNEVYMRTANLPVAYSIESLGGAGTMKAICSSVISGGGFNPLGNTKAIMNPLSVAIASGDSESLCGIRLKSDHFEYTVKPEFVSILSLSNGNSLWRLCYNPTYSGSVTWVDVPNSAVQEAYNANNIVTDFGEVVAAGTFSNNADNLNEAIDTALRIGKDLAGNLDELWLVVTALGNETYYGCINFKELL